MEETKKKYRAMRAGHIYDATPREWHVRRIAKSRVRHWRMKVVAWLCVYPQKRAGERLPERTTVQAGAVKLCRSVEPTNGTTEVFAWLWPEDRLRMSVKTPRALVLVGGARLDPKREYEGVDRMARYLAVREAAQIVKEARR